MTVSAKTIAPWQQTRNTLNDALALVGEQMEMADYSEAPESDYQKLRQAREVSIDALQAHAVLGLKQVDAAIAGSDLVKRLKSASTEAKKEADRIKNAAKMVNEIAALVNQVTGVVTLFGDILAL
jgi:hypothetical protein